MVEKRGYERERESERERGREREKRCKHKRTISTTSCLSSAT